MRAEEKYIKFSLLHFDFSIFGVRHARFFIALKHFIMCMFLIHSDSVQKMLTDLFI